MSEHSLFKVTKEQLLEALEKAINLSQQMNEVKVKMQEPVTVKSWFGLRKRVMTKDKHTQMLTGSNYALTAYILDYIDLKEKQLSDYLWKCPSLKSLKSWLKVEEAYLCSDDFDKLYTLLYKEPGE